MLVNSLELLQILWQYFPVQFLDLFEASPRLLQDLAPRFTCLREPYDEMFVQLLTVLVFQVTHLAAASSAMLGLIYIIPRRCVFLEAIRREFCSPSRFVFLVQSTLSDCPSVRKNALKLLKGLFLHYALPDFLVLGKQTVEALQLEISLRIESMEKMQLLKVSRKLTCFLNYLRMGAEMFPCPALRPGVVPALTEMLRNDDPEVRQATSCLMFDLSMFFSVHERAFLLEGLKTCLVTRGVESDLSAIEVLLSCPQTGRALRQDPSVSAELTAYAMHSLLRLVRRMDARFSLAVLCLEKLAQASPAVKQQCRDHSEFLDTLHLLTYPGTEAASVFQLTIDFLRLLQSQEEIRQGHAAVSHMLLGHLPTTAAAETQGCFCLDTVKGTGLRLPCGHVFHAKCIRGWIPEYGRQCPMCRAEPLHVVANEIVGKLV